MTRPRSARRPVDSQGSKGVILAVEDTPDSLFVLTEILTGAGHEVHPAGSGESALASVATIKPDLILLDIRIPGMDGFEVLDRIKANKETRNIPVIFLSALNDSQERVTGLKRGAVDYISMPFQKEELLARVANHLELSQLRLRLEQTVALRTASLQAAIEQLRFELAERKRTEHALIESESRFRSMADSAPVVIWTSGPDLKITFCNKYGLTLMGITMDEITGEGWKAFLHPDDLRVTYPAYLPVIAERREYRVEYRLRRADGEYRWMLDSAVPRLLTDGAFAGYIGVLTDITDLKRNSEQLSAAQRLESLGVLAGGVTHNIGNLLATVIAESDLALSDLPPGTPGRESIERISAFAIRTADVVSLLTAYAGTATAGEPSIVNLSDLVQESIQLFRAALAKRADIRANLTPRLPAICADISKLRQIVMNLLTNAWEALPGGEGTISVATSAVVIEMGHTAWGEENLTPGSYVRLEVADSGCGIAESSRSRIFEPFFTTKLLGGGLGLSAVQGIVHGLRGAVRVHSVPGAGSSFEILVPACQL